jgi:hypothetical protein
MSSATTPHPVAVQPPALGSFDTDGANYAVGFAIEVPSGDERSTEQWARAILEDAPVVLRVFIVAGWRFVLGLRLGPRHSPDHVLGWKVTARLPGETVLESRSAFMTARLVFHRDGTHLVWATFVHYSRPIAGLIWPPVSLLHRRIVPYALRRAASDLSASPGSES